MTAILESSPTLPEGMRYPWGMNEPVLRAFRADHPVHDRTVFLVMRFKPHPLRDRIHRQLREAGDRLGFDIVRADDRDYSGELWTNVRLCMDGSALAVAVFDNESVDAPNMAFELGYLLSRGVPCLILREQSLGPPPAMLAHRLHVGFAEHDIEGTLVPAFERWLTSRRGDGVV